MDTQRLHDYELTEEERHDLIYGHPMHYIQAQTSAAHTYGNVTAFVQNWLINLFPKDFFKTIHVNSKIAHTQMRSTPKVHVLIGMMTVDSFVELLLLSVRVIST